MGVLYLAGMAIAVVTMSGARLQAESIPTETQLRVETTGVGTHSVATFTVHVDRTDREGAAAGVVMLLEGSRQLGSAALDEAGDAQLVTGGLTPGAHTVHAEYAGSGDLASSLSLETQVTTEATGVPSFTVAPVSALTVAQGNTVTATLTLTPVNGFSGYVTLSCSKLTPDASCAFVPTNVFVSGTASSPSVLSIETFGVTGPNAQLRSHSGLVFALLLPGLLGMVGMGQRGRKAFQTAGMLLLTVSVMAGMSGCAQRYHYLNKPPQSSPGTPLGATTFNLEAQSISGTTVITNDYSVALTVTAPKS